jgi:hypothetical protein
MDLQLLQIRIDDLLTAIRALSTILLARSLFILGRTHRFRGDERRTMEVGFGALTGRPLALTGARVPAASAFLCSRWICGVELVG